MVRKDFFNKLTLAAETQICWFVAERVVAHDWLHECAEQVSRAMRTLTDCTRNKQVRRELANVAHTYRREHKRVR